MNDDQKIIQVGGIMHHALRGEIPFDLLDRELEGLSSAERGLVSFVRYMMDGEPFKLASNDPDRTRYLDIANELDVTDIDEMEDPPGEKIIIFYPPAR